MCDQCSLRHHLIHLRQKHLLAGFLGAQIEVQGSLFHGLYFLRWGLRQAHKWGSYAEFPLQSTVHKNCWLVN